MTVTLEIEENGLLPFLDIKRSPENKKFAASAHREPAFSRVFTNFESFIPDSHKPWLNKTFS